LKFLKKSQTQAFHIPEREGLKTQGPGESACCHSGIQPAAPGAVGHQYSAAASTAIHGLTGVVTQRGRLAPEHEEDQ